MKIPFTLDAWLKDKSQKIETGEGELVHILCTNAEGVLPIIGNVGEESENLQRWTGKGQYHVGLSTPNKDLFIVTPEEEPTEFEKACMKLYHEGRDDGFSGDKLSNESVKESASELLSLAKQQLLLSGELLTQEHHEKLMETLRKECKKDLPRWKKVGVDTGQTNLIKGYTREEDELYRNGKCISLVSLENPPGFKEDESHE